LAGVRVDVVGEHDLPAVIFKREPDKADPGEEFGNAELLPRGGLPTGGGLSGSSASTFSLAGEW
jgi:hypothetical protein